jgi:chromatin remodeling complex protein RSC6
MATAKKAPAKKAAPATKAAAPAKKAAAPAKAPRKANAAFLKPLTPSAELAAVIGSTPLPRTEVTRQIWDYIKKHNLQDAANKRNINADAKLKVLFGKDQVTMFELTKIVSGHLK